MLPFFHLFLHVTSVVAHRHRAFVKATDTWRHDTVHSTNDLDEFTHDFGAVFGVDGRTYAENGAVSSLAALAANAAAPPCDTLAALARLGDAHVVLRDFEDLIDPPTRAHASDLDLLVDSLPRARAALASDAARRHQHAGFPAFAPFSAPETPLGVKIRYRFLEFHFSVTCSIPDDFLLRI